MEKNGHRKGLVAEFFFAKVFAGGLSEITPPPGVLMPATGRVRLPSANVSDLESLNGGYLIIAPPRLIAGVDTEPIAAGPF